MNRDGFFVEKMSKGLKEKQLKNSMTRRQFG